MGTLKKHRQFLAWQMGQLFNSLNGNISTCTYKDTAGNSYTQILGGYAVTSNAAVGNNLNMLIPVATGDDISDYDFEDYAITPVGTTTYTVNRTVTNNTTDHIYACDFVFNVSIQNSTDSDIIVKCIRFQKAMCVSGTSSGGIKTVMLYSYYLDNPLTIAAGDTESISIDFYVSN